MKNVLPLREVEITGDDHRPPLVSLCDDAMEVLVLPGADGLEFKVVDDEQVRLDQSRQLALEVTHGHAEARRAVSTGE